MKLHSDATTTSTTTKRRLRVVVVFSFDGGDDFAILVHGGAFPAPFSTFPRVPLRFPFQIEHPGTLRRAIPNRGLFVPPVQLYLLVVRALLVPLDILRGLSELGFRDWHIE